MTHQNKSKKDEFVAVLREAGLSEEQMVAIHRSFEKLSPEGHRAFLKFLEIGEEEIQRIRKL